MSRSYKKPIYKPKDSNIKYRDYRGKIKSKYKNDIASVNAGLYKKYTGKPHVDIWDYRLWYDDDVIKRMSRK